MVVYLYNIREFTCLLVKEPSPKSTGSVTGGYVITLS